MKIKREQISKPNEAKPAAAAANVEAQKTALQSAVTPAAKVEAQKTAPQSEMTAPAQSTRPLTGDLASAHPVVSASLGFSAAPPDDANAPAKPHPMNGDIGVCPFHNAMKRGDPEKLREVALETMRDRVFGDDSLQKAEKIAVTALQADPVDAKGETNHLLGLVAFRQEKWGDALKFLEVAARRDPQNADIADLLERATQNSGSRVDRPFGYGKPFDKDKLLESPTLQLREPEGLEPLPKKSVFEKTKLAVENAVGTARGKLAHAASEVAFKEAAKHVDKGVTYAFESWDQKDAVRGELELGVIREGLNERLRSTYPGDVGFQQPNQVRPEWTERFRTATGAWTTDHPMEGAAGTEFQSSAIQPSQRVNRAEDPSLPSAREVSRVILSAKGPRTTVPFLNNLAIAWIQFENHDWVSHGPNQAQGAYEVKLADDDPLKRKYGMSTLSVPKTAENVLAQPDKVSHLNEVTHWWDGSQIYGSDQATQDRLRTGADGQRLAGGKLRIEGELLPINAETGVEDSGFTRNWWVGLDLFHTLFVKNHNALCDTLKEKHPDWSSDQLFNTARLINAAEMAKIHTVEWTPAVLPNQKLVNAMNTNWYGGEETLTHKAFDRKTLRPGEPKDPIAGGLVGGKTDNHGKPYALTEEFTEVYRLHAGMLDHVDVLPVGARQATANVTAEDTRGADARDLVEKFGLTTLLNSFGNQHMTALVNNNYPSFFQDMSVDGSPVADLGTLDLMRARERGVPQYNDFRRKLGLTPLKRFEDLGCSAETVKDLERLYGKAPEGLEKMDLLAGTLCEARRPDHFGFGETLFTVFIQMASRRLQADPFYTEKYDADHYTQEGLDLIDHCSLKGLLLQHFPELAKSGLAGVNNAFEPWSSDVKTKPEEHPLSTGLEKY